MSQFLAQTNTALDRVLNDLRQRLGLGENQQTDLLQRLTTLASWIIEQAENGHRIEVKEALDRLSGHSEPDLSSRVVLDDDEVRRLAELLDRRFSPTPALRKLLVSLADPDYEPPQLDWANSGS